MAIKIPETDNYFQYGSCGELSPVEFASRMQEMMQDVMQSRV